MLLVLSEATRFVSTSLAEGVDPAVTPSLSRLAERGQVFRRAYAPANGTLASVASVLAMAPVSFAELDVRPRFWRGRLREGRSTAMEAMQAAGRATFWVGHDHRGCFTNTIEGLDQCFDERVLVPQERFEPADADADARIADAAIEAIVRHRRAGKRYFGLVFFVSPHDDYQVHDAAAPHDTEEARYRQELSFMDAQLGRLLDTLEAQGALEDTVVIFTGDHGEAFGEHGEHHHLTSLHDEQIHVPLVVHVPGLAPGAHVRPTSTGYVLPWLLLRGAPEERTEAERVLIADVGPMMRATDNAVLSEMIGPRRQEAALIWERSTVLYESSPTSRPCTTPSVIQLSNTTCEKRAPGGSMRSRLPPAAIARRASSVVAFGSSHEDNRQAFPLRSPGLLAGRRLHLRRVVGADDARRALPAGRSRGSGSR